MSFAFPAWSWPVIELLGVVPPSVDSGVMFGAQEALAGAGQQVAELGQGIEAAVGTVAANLEGAPAEAAAAFLGQVRGGVGELVEAAGNLGQYAGEAGLAIETTNYSILGILAWTLYEIYELLEVPFGEELIPEVLALSRVAVTRLLALLLRSVAEQAAVMAGINAVVQAIEFLKGDRTRWDFGETVGALEAGAVFGAVGGLLHLGGGLVAPELAGSLAGRVVLGGATNVASTAILDKATGSSSPLAIAAAGGAAAGGLAGLAGRQGAGEGLPGDAALTAPGLAARDLAAPDLAAPDLAALSRPGQDGAPGGLAALDGPAAAAEAEPAAAVFPGTGRTLDGGVVQGGPLAAEAEAEPAAAVFPGTGRTLDGGVVQGGPLAAEAEAEPAAAVFPGTGRTLDGGVVQGGPLAAEAEAEPAAAVFPGTGRTLDGGVVQGGPLAAEAEAAGRGGVPGHRADAGRARGGRGPGGPGGGGGGAGSGGVPGCGAGAGRGRAGGADGGGGRGHGRAAAGPGGGRAGPGRAAGPPRHRARLRLPRHHPRHHG